MIASARGEASECEKALSVQAFFHGWSVDLLTLTISKILSLRVRTVVLFCTLGGNHIIAYLSLWHHRHSVREYSRDNPLTSVLHDQIEV